MINRIVDKIGRSSPDFIGRLIVNFPFKFSQGDVYSEFENKIKESKEWNEKELESYIVTNFNKIFQHAKKFDFYRDKYKKDGLLDLEVKSLGDIKKIPILTKSEIRDKVSEFKGTYTAKTGGTTGKPLTLYLDKNVWEREWAHYNSIWKIVEYKFPEAKFSFRDLSSKDKFIKYDFRHNEYFVNIFKICNMSNDNIDEIFKILKARNVKYIKGIPSAIIDFLKEIDGKISRNQKELFQQQIKCCFFNSEFPSPQMTNYLKNKWNLDFIAGYGHSEICVFAATDINGIDYYPYHTYGYAEVEDNMLLGTSYHNFDMPLIRYNTDDLVRPKRYSNGILKSFEIKEGRVVDIIFDKDNLRIPITGMILRANHEIFDYVDHIQVFQEKKGFSTILISQKKFTKLDVQSLMNLKDININFEYIYLKKPIRTSSGKVPLRIHKLP